MREISDREQKHIAKIIEKEVAGTPEALFGQRALEIAAIEATEKIYKYLIARDKKVEKMMRLP